MQPNIAQLGNWITSWVQPDGAVHGFHNHTVWGGNPYRWADFTAGHSTWASPFLAGLSMLLASDMDARGLALLRQLIHYQTGAFQPDGQYAHIGFQVGELLNFGLIHNAITNLSLGLTALYGRDFLPTSDLDAIRQAIITNMTACERYGGGRAAESGVANQDYARLWAKLVFQLAFEDHRWRDEIVQDLDFMIQHFHVGGFPDNDCEATWRVLRDHSAVEPAEYYGLMISPLVTAYEVYGEARYLEHAGRICRHVARSSWQDHRGQTRFHRLWYRHGSEWRVNNEPMLISGMGDTLEGIHRYTQHHADHELIAFLDACDTTYVTYQHPRGFFAPATGWQSEVDIAPSTAWHAHDFRYLALRYGAEVGFWERFFAPITRPAVLLGDQCFWFEDGEHWQIRDYFWQDVYQLLGRKDQVRFGRDMAWIGGPNALPDTYNHMTVPEFLKTSEGIYLKSGDINQLDVMAIASVPYLGAL